MPFGCPHCKEEIDGAMSTADYLDFKKKTKEREDAVKAELADADKQLKEAEKKLKSLPALEEQLQEARGRIEKTERTEALREVKAKDTPRHLRIFSREHEDYVKETMEADPKAEPLSFADWLKSPDGARKNEALADYFGGEPATPPNGAPPKPPAEQAKPPRDRSDPPGNAGNRPPPQVRAKSDAEVLTILNADPVYVGHTKAMDAARAKGDKTALDAAAAAARTRLGEIRTAVTAPVATP